MTEKEIIEQIKNDINVGEFYGITEEAIKGLLNLYKKQKEANKSIVYNYEKLVDKYEELSDKYFELLGESNNE